MHETQYPWNNLLSYVEALFVYSPVLSLYTTENMCNGCTRMVVLLLQLIKTLLSLNMQTQVRRLGGVYGDCKEDKNLELLTGYKYTIRVSFLIHLLIVFKQCSCSKVLCFFRESFAHKVTGCGNHLQCN